MTRRGFFAIAGAAVRDDSMARMADRDLPEYVLIRQDTGAPIAARWEAGPAPLGSLAKPFLALAYGESHDQRYPEFECSGCWLPQGHGRLGITTALAQSCNSYFVQLAQQVAFEDVERTAIRYGLPAPPAISPESLIGRYGSWRADPLALARAYGELAHRQSEPGAACILDAMRQCARNGTASAIGARIPAKTGTAPCVHTHRAPGDGLVAAILPDYVLLARAHGMPGAECARRAGPFIRAVLR